MTKKRRRVPKSLPKVINVETPAKAESSGPLNAKQKAFLEEVLAMTDPITQEFLDRIQKEDDEKYEVLELMMGMI